MPSPFPGMDPYLEAFDIWPGLHHILASELTTELNSSLPAPYYAALRVRQELGIVVGVARPALPLSEPESGGVAVLTRSRREVSKFIDFQTYSERVRHHFVEIRDSSRGHKLITLIEILSPSNKRPGPDREAYERKQSEVLQSDANLIEMDLLRGGRRVLADLSLAGMIAGLEPPADYLVLVNRAWRRLGEVSDYQVFPVGLREWLPCIPVPLKEGEADVPLDLQFVFNRAYDGGPYRRGAVDYAEAVPALTDADAAWAGQLTRGWRGA